MKKITNKILIIAVSLLFIGYFVFFSYLINAMRNDTMLDFVETLFIIDDQTKYK